MCFDEGNLFYDRSQDHVIGLAIDDKGDNMLFKPALTANVLMLRGLYSKWKQPFAFFLCHTSCPAAFLKQILAEALKKN